MVDKIYKYYQFNPLKRQSYALYAGLLRYARKPCWE